MRLILKDAGCWQMKNGCSPPPRGSPCRCGWKEMVPCHLATCPTSDGQSLFGTSFSCSINSDWNSNICLATSIYKEPSANKADCSLRQWPGVGVALAFPWKWWCYSHYSSQQFLFLPAVMRELWKEGCGWWHVWHIGSPSPHCWRMLDSWRMEKETEISCHGLTVPTCLWSWGSSTGVNRSVPELLRIPWPSTACSSFTWQAAQHHTSCLLTSPQWEGRIRKR